MMAEASLSKEDFIAVYTARARAVGFDVTTTADGCNYAEDAEYNMPEARKLAVPCDCHGHIEGWHMVDAPIVMAS